MKVNSKNEITIITPDGLTIKQTQEQKIIEVFISKILLSLSDKKLIKFNYEKHHGIFSCNDRDVKEILTMIARLKILDNFYVQFKKTSF